MNRLTFYDEFNNPCYRTKQYSPLYEQMIDTVVSNSDVARKLAHYEELAEQSRLIILPPDYLQIYEKIGDCVYELITDECEVTESLLINIEMSETNIQAILIDNEDGNDSCVRPLTVSLDCFGKTVFLTREESEQALQAVQE